MDENDHFNKMKLDHLRARIQAGIASGDAGTLDAEEIKRRGRARALELSRARSEIDKCQRRTGSGSDLKTDPRTTLKQ